jgi:hypothetical protein
MVKFVNAIVWYLDQCRTKHLLAEKPRVDPGVEESQLALTADPGGTQLTASNCAVNRLRSTARSIRRLTDLQPLTCMSHDPPLSIPHQQSNAMNLSGHRLPASTGLDRGPRQGREPRTARSKPGEAREDP